MSRNRKILGAALVVGVGLVLTAASLEVPLDRLSVPAVPLVEAPGAEQLPGTLATTTRRLWPADPNKWFEVNCAFPDGRRIGASENSERGGVLIRDLQTGEDSMLMPPGTQASYMYVEDCAVSPDGLKVAYTDYSVRVMEETGNSMELRVISSTGGKSYRIRGGHDPDVGWMWIRGWTPDGRDVLVSEALSAERSRVHLVADPDGSTRELPVAYDSFEFGFSPDGRYLAYDDASAGRPRDGVRDLFVFDLETNGVVTLLESSDDDRMIGWAPDGSHVLFLRNRGRGPAVYRLPVAGGRAAGEPELVLPDAWGFIPVGFTETGGYLYGLRTGITELYVATLDDDGRRMVTPPARLAERDFRNVTHPDWHPDGKQVVYLVHEDPNYMIRGRRGLVARSLETGQTRTFVPPDGFAWVSNPRWSGNGRWIFVSAAREGVDGFAILRVDVASGTSEVVVEPRTDENGRVSPRHTAFDVSADGRYLYHGTRTQIVRHDMRTGEAVELWSHTGEGNHNIYWVELSPDDQRLLAQSYHGGDMRFIVPTGGGEPTMLHARRSPEIPDGFVHAGNRESMMWSPDGTALLYLLRDEDDEGRYVLFRRSLAGGAPEPVGLEFEKPWNDWHDVLGKIRFDPEGRRVIFSSGLREQELWIMENFLPKAGGR